MVCQTAVEIGNPGANSERQDDQHFGENDNDTIADGIGNDSIFGGNGNDVCAGQVGADTVTGDAGNDTITGGSGGGINDDGDVVTDVAIDIRKTLMLVFSNGAFLVTL